jgi:hypothetical protein
VGFALSADRVRPVRHQIIRPAALLVDGVADLDLIPGAQPVRAAGERKAVLVEFGALGRMPACCEQRVQAAGLLCDEVDRDGLLQLVGESAGGVDGRALGGSMGARGQPPVG